MKKSKSLLFACATLAIAALVVSVHNHRTPSSHQEIAALTSAGDAYAPDVAVDVTAAGLPADLIQHDTKYESSFSSLAPVVVYAVDSRRSSLHLAMASERMDSTLNAKFQAPAVEPGDSI